MKKKKKKKKKKNKKKVTPDVLRRAPQALGTHLLARRATLPPAPPPRSVQRTARTQQIRKRVTPLMARMAAVKYNFKCGICGKTLNAT